MSARIRSFLFGLVLVATACGLRWPGLNKTVWNLDEGSTFTMAEIVKHGGVMYRDAADNRTPLVPYLKAVILAVVGDWNIRGAHVIMAILLGLTAVWLWRLSRQGKDEATGMMAAIYFTFLSFMMLDTADAMAAHTGWFLIFFSALGMWAFVAALDKRSSGFAIVAGTAFALAALAKQPGILDWGVCLVVCGLIAFIFPMRRNNCGRLAAMLTLGFVWPLVVTYGYFSANRAWSDFLQYSWFYNTRLYIPEVPLADRLLGIVTPLELARSNAPFAFWFGILAAGWLLVCALPNLWKRPKDFAVLPWLILGWSASGLAATILSGRTFAHYSIQVIPGLSLACGWVTVRIWQKSAGWREGVPRFGGWLIRAAVGLGVLSLAWAAVRRSSTFDLSEGVSKEIGLVIKARTQPTEKIFVWGYEPELHVFSERLPNTRFVYSVFLTGLIPWTNLDPQKNTDYAIVPGAWDAFWQDFTLRPPSIIIDTHSNRGFVKYPLRHQTELWKLIQKHYVEVAEDYARLRGYSLYQRATAIAPKTNLDELPIDNQMQLAAPARTLPGSLKIRVASPAGSTAVDLYLDGRPYRRIENSGKQAEQFGFFLLEPDLTIGTHSLQAIARGTQDAASPRHSLTVESVTSADRYFAGPPLIYAGRDFFPIESETANGQPIVQQKETGQWDAHAPSRLVYLRPEGMAKVDFTFGMLPGSYQGNHVQRTDGIDVMVYFEDDNGRQTRLYSRGVNPVTNDTDRLLLSGHAALPGSAGGKIIFLITPGALNNPAYDWAYWRSISGENPVIPLTFRGQPVLPIPPNTKPDLALVDFRSRRVLLAPAPSHFAFSQMPGMSGFSGEFGLLDESWQGPQQSSGAIFEIERVLPDGTPRTLFSRTLYPANKDDDRGVQSFQIPLEYTEGAQIHLTTRTTNPVNNSLNYTFWHGLTLNEFSGHLDFEGREIRSISSEAVNGFAYMEEDRHEVLFAHAPSQITFPIGAEARRLKGEIGLLRRAYAGEGQTDGVVFVVEVETLEGNRHEIFRRHLNPREVPADRGSIPVSLDLPPLPGGHLILRTLSAPSGKLNCAWSYWGKLQLSR